MPKSSQFSLPTIINDENREFWRSCKRRELRLQCCSECGTIRYPIYPVCFKCLSEKFEWRKMSGRGKVTTFIIYHKRYPWTGEYANKVPYNVAEIQLEEGPRIASNIVGLQNDKIENGMQVQLLFEDVNNLISLPKFKPV
jgi:uncharacterized protein